MSLNNDVINSLKCLGAQGITAKSSQNIVRSPSVVSSIGTLDILISMLTVLKCLNRIYVKT